MQFLHPTSYSNFDNLIKYDGGTCLSFIFKAAFKIFSAEFGKFLNLFNNSHSSPILCRAVPVELLTKGILNPMFVGLICFLS